MSHLDLLTAVAAAVLLLLAAVAALDLVLLAAVAGIAESGLAPSWQLLHRSMTAQVLICV